MKKKLAIGAVSAVLAASLLGASGARASTEFGSNCTATVALPGASAWQTAAGPTNPLPLLAPTSGVITKWKTTIESKLPGSIPQQLLVLRPVGGPKQVKVIAVSSVANVIAGANSVETRLPIQAGDLLGLAGGEKVGGLFCAAADPANRIAVVAGNPAVGSTVVPFEEGPAELAAAAIIEPDADGDGFGDETQDKCPQSAAVQTACPVISLSVSTTRKKKLVSVIVTSTSTAKVTVNGKVSLGKGKKAKLKGGTKSAAPGHFTKFHLVFPASLVDRLEELAPKQSLTLKITTSAPNVAAPPTKKVLKVRLRGQGPKN
jgi:hypothetical protein